MKPRSLKGAKFQRDAVFWTLALQVAVVNFYLGGFGPAQTLLRAQQHTSLTVAGLHGTALGISSIIAGLVSTKIVHVFGRAAASWMGLGIFATGVGLFVLLPSVQLTLLATLIGGFGAFTVVNFMVTQMSHHYPVDESSAISQASGVASAGFILGTLTVGAIATTSLNWRFGLLLTVPATIILFFITRSRLATEHVPDEHGPQRGKLSGKFWIAWIGFFTCISSEFATTFWAAALIRDRIGESAAFSVISIVAVGSGMGTGRWFGPHVMKRFALDNQLKVVIAIHFAGFTVLWFSHTLPISLFALFVVGLGISMQYALASLRLIRLSENRPDLAIGKSSLGAGLAVASAPFLLALLGDHFGISRAYLMVPVLIFVAFSTTLAIPSEQPTVVE